MPARIVLGPPAHSGPKPHTENRKSLVEVDEGTHAEAADAAASERSGSAAKKLAADWKADVEKATTQEELDAVVQAYEDSGAEYATVETAIEAKQAEIDGSGD